MPWYAPLLAGGIAGVGKHLQAYVEKRKFLICTCVVGWAPTFPFDVVKTRMQGTPQRYTVPQKHQIDVARPISLTRRLTLNALESDPYRTVTSTIVNSYRAEGMGVFFRGLAPTLIR
jgi:solute carrier family 25 (mitochondrial carnitine/acylcarnitine transporter), member 20/29